MATGAIAGSILSAIAPPLLRMRSQLDVDTAALQASARALLQGLTHRDDRTAISRDAPQHQ
jgi:hypothetical protein